MCLCVRLEYCVVWELQSFFFTFYYLSKTKHTSMYIWGKHNGFSINSLLFWFVNWKRFKGIFHYSTQFSVEHEYIDTFLTVKLWKSTLLNIPVLLAGLRPCMPLNTYNLITRNQYVRNKSRDEFWVSFKISPKYFNHVYTNFTQAFEDCFIKPPTEYITILNSSEIDRK